MNIKFSSHIWLASFIIALVLQGCGVSAPAVNATIAPTDALEPPKPTSITPLWEQPVELGVFNLTIPLIIRWKQI